MLFRLFLVVIFLPRVVSGQLTGTPDSVVKPNYKARKIALDASSSVVAVGSLVGLSVAWYKNDSVRKFHTFNDNTEWLQMDKAGHVWTTYQIGRLMMQSMEWAGYSKCQSEIYGGCSGFVYMSLVEILDGYATGYGFSWGDMGANAAGTVVSIAQHRFWDEQRIAFKFSFHQTSYPQYRPELLGENLAQQVLKDYNGQTYWLSVNPSSFIKKANRFPRWLNVAVGYGASGMISGENNYVYVGPDGKIVGNQRYRRIFLSLDVDLTRLPVKSKFLKGLFSALNCLKIPFPTLEWNGSKIAGHGLYF